jgi:hypothetical protein
MRNLVLKSSNRRSLATRYAQNSDVSPDSRPRIIQTPFGVEEFLNQDGVELTQKRFDEMTRIFNSMNSTTLTGLARNYPILLALESSSLLRAKNILSENIPYVDIEYLFEQKAAGLEFFINCAASEFDFKTQISSLKETLDMKNNTELLIEDFIRRVPHALGLRYQFVLKSHISVLEKRYQMDKSSISKTVMKWPSVLNVVNLTTALDKLEIGLKKAGLPNETWYIRKLISKVPRVVVQDVHKKVDALIRAFPDWKMKEILIENPRMLTQKIRVIGSRFQVSLYSKNYI